MIYRILLLVGVMFNVAAQFFLKTAMKGYDIFRSDSGIVSNILMIFLKPYFWLSMSFYSVGFLLYSITLSKLDLGKAYPVASVAAIALITIISILFLKEQFDIFKAIGLVLCIAGIIFIFR